MSINQSYLSGPQYGYSMVVATTQQSINSTMKAYLSMLSQPLMEICYVADEQGVATQIPFAELLERAKGSNPFTVPANADPKTNQDLLNLRAARFMTGFRARIGIPLELAPTEIPDIVKFNFSNTTTVTFSLMCSEFTLADLRPGGDYSPARWLLESQPLDKPWIFEAQVNLLQFTVGSEQYNELPPDVQNAISQYDENTFSVQQLLFNLDQASLQRSPRFLNVEPGSALDDVLNRRFLRLYFDQLQQDGSPVLGCTVTRNGNVPNRPSVTVTNVQMQVGPYVDSSGIAIPNPSDEQQSLATLNYLCAVDDASPRPATLFTWNWVTASEGTDGVVALNRNVFAKYIKDQIYNYAIKNCYQPSVRVWTEAGWDGITVWYQWGLNGYQTPSVTMPEQNATVLRMNYSAKAADEAGASGAWGRMELEPMYDLDVTFSGNTIVVKQHLKIYCYVRFLQSRAGGDVVDITITNTYTLEVKDGQLLATRQDKKEDHSERPSENGFLNFWADVNSLSDDVKEWAGSIADAAFDSLPLSVIQSFVFPGGNTFVFKDVVFSDNQDLVARVTYADPSQPAAPSQRSDPRKYLHLSKLGRSGHRATRMVVTNQQMRELRAV